MSNNKTQNYLGNPNLKRSNVNVSFTPEQVEEYIKCSKDPAYFIRKYVKIVSLDKGLINFDMFDFQETFVNTIHDNRFTIGKMPRQCGKSTTLVSYIIWYILFSPSVNVAILANKQTVAKLHMDRLKVAYEYLPKWLQQGVKEWNKMSIELENGSKVTAAATSGSAIRGGSFNLIMLDEFAHVPDNIANDFYSSVFPTITSGKTTKLVIISTPNGLNLFYKIWVDSVEERNDFKNVEIHWKQVPGRDEKWKDREIKNLGSEEEFRKEHECDFIGSSNTLISSNKLKTMVFRNPIYKNDLGQRVYEKPQEKHSYIMVVDTSRGQGLDYNAFCIFDITEIPYKVVSIFRNNVMSPMVYPNIIFAAAREYNDAFVLVEINDIGGQVADILYKDMEYENILVSSVRGRKGQTLDGGFGNVSTQLGVRTTKVVKRLGCSVLKSMIESDKLILNDIDVMRELVTFVSKQSSYEADTGHNDDLVMCLVLFGWLSTQSYFKDLTDLDIRKTLFQKQIDAIEEDVMPFGFLNIEDAFQRDEFGEVFGDTIL
jgi:hypothetical protein